MTDIDQSKKSISEIRNAISEIGAKVLPARIDMRAVSAVVEIDLSYFVFALRHFRPRTLYVVRKPFDPASCLRSRVDGDGDEADGGLAQSRAVEAEALNESTSHILFVSDGLVHFCRYDERDEAFSTPQATVETHTTPRIELLSVGQTLPLGVRVNFDMTKYSLGSEHYVITGPDPQLILVEMSVERELSLSKGRYCLAFLPRMIEGRLRRPILFLDMGSGFCDAPGEMFLLDEAGEGEWRVEFEIQSEAFRLRLDPSDAPTGMFEILEISITVLPSKFNEEHKQNLDNASRLLGKSSTFCVSPFLQGEIMTTGIMKPCCMFNGPISQNGNVMSVYSETFDDIWNSANMREVRRKLIHGETADQCRNCAAIEDQGEKSARIDSNTAWGSLKWANPHNETFEDLIVTALSNDFRMPEGPSWIDLDLGNLCNLKCRMCSPASSSSIASDPVHARWAHFEEGAPARWRGREMVLAPSRAQGIHYEGFSLIDRSEHVAVCWIVGGTAAIRVAQSVGSVSAFRIRFGEQGCLGERIQIFANETPLLDCELTPENLSHTLPLSDSDSQGDLAIRIDCSGRIAVEDISLIRSEAGSNNIGINRFPDGKQWHQNISFIRDEVLRNKSRITKIQLVGGEPFLIRESLQTMQALVAEGIAAKINLVLITNGTVISEKILTLLSMFKEVSLLLSLDGVGAINDYIRHGSKWHEIDANIRQLARVPNLSISVNCTLQAYNMLNVSELAEYVEQLDLGFQCQLLTGPLHLSCAAMPPTVRNKAAVRMRRYALGGLSPDAARTCRSDISATFLRLAAALEASAPHDGGLLQEFMSFTNDLDFSRGQSISTFNRELFDCIEASGIEWATNLRFAKRSLTPADRI
ncbi:MAG TPA: SPASM domain-containing protein [Methylocystis sp.]|jgi:hypothetical protein